MLLQENITSKAPMFEVPCKQVLANSEYHAHPAIGSTSLKTVLRSPLHYKHQKEAPDETTPSKEFGIAVHEAILEPNLFMANAIVMPKFSGTGSVAKKDAWLLENHGKRVLKEDDMADISGILGSLRNHQIGRALISGGAAEESYFDQCPDTGLVRKARPDFLRDGKIIVDIKTTKDASPENFPREIAKYLYHLSGAYYLDVVSNVIGQKFDQFIILAIEKNPPYAIAAYLMDEATIEAGRFLYKKALQKLKACRESGAYPGYPEKLMTLSLPGYAWPVEDEE